MMWEVQIRSSAWHCGKHRVCLLQQPEFVPRILLGPDPGDRVTRGAFVERAYAMGEAGRFDECHGGGNVNVREED